MKRTISKSAAAALMICAAMIAAAVAIFGVQNAAPESAPALSRYGSSGEEVRLIQTKLKNWGYYGGAIDGIYGSETQAAVKYFQQKNGLTADGIAGVRTLAAMGISSQSQASSYTQSERSLLTRIISAEARGEPYEGQVAVGAVILNRVEHPSFPNTIAGVVYQPGAFSALDDGQFDEPVNQACARAADAAMAGSDPSGGAIYYYNPATSTNKWILSRPVIKRIGNHVFAA
ncbi:MAG: spore cortex-lytic enzyme [Clostridia bacterium]|nr:spore cortex-lytic enzyme [Clostridia bacterium]